MCILLVLQIQHNLLKSRSSSDMIQDRGMMGKKKDVGEDLIENRQRKEMCRKRVWSIQRRPRSVCVAIQAHFL